MKEVYIEGINGNRSVGETVVVENARELIEAIRKAASESLGVRSYTINDRSGDAVTPIGLDSMDEKFESICAISIVPYNKAGI
jgi:L,D-peptidoglycan transpeptidase YkuD (ErfK/YbiS/YcfS/YnhG family)